MGELIRYRSSGFLIRSWLLPSYIVTDQGVDGWRILLVPYQNQILSRPGCGVGVGLPSFYSQGFSPRTGTGTVGIRSGGNDVLACRQITVVVSALCKASYVLAIDGQDKAEIGPKIWHPVNQQMT